VVKLSKLVAAFKSVFILQGMALNPVSKKNTSIALHQFFDLVFIPQRQFALATGHRMLQALAREFHAIF